VAPEQSRHPAAQLQRLDAVDTCTAGSIQSQREGKNGGSVGGDGNALGKRAFDTRHAEIGGPELAAADALQCFGGLGVWKAQYAWRLDANAPSVICVHEASPAFLI